jgi:hypothetical protein
MMKSHVCNEAVPEEILVEEPLRITPKCDTIDPSTGEMALRRSRLK